jgi:hypothetical protein
LNKKVRGNKMTRATAKFKGHFKENYTKTYKTITLPAVYMAVKLESLTLSEV